jgi:hypothetical protein
MILLLMRLIDTVINLTVIWYIFGNLMDLPLWGKFIVAGIGLISYTKPTTITTIKTTKLD